VSTWQDSAARRQLYRAVIKSRVEAEARFGSTMPVRRGLGRVNRSNLAWLAAVYGSDKGAISHNYVDLYERHLAPLRRSTRRVLEIGIYRGASLMMWRDYFPRAEVYGVDINPVEVHGSRLHAMVGDQSDPALLERLRALGPWDLIVDDGSHKQSHVLATFAGLYDAVMPGGFYVIEDMHTSYMPRGYEGGPPGTPDTSVSLVGGLLDGVNRRFVEKEYPDDAAALTPVAEVHLYEKIAFLRRPVE
jgi:hypothetical protein